MRVKRVNISLPSRIEDMARVIMAQRGFDDLSGFLQTLIREDYERRDSHGKLLRAELIVTSASELLKRVQRDNPDGSRLKSQ
jgi:Arc/MetJ-type ribon-helix-helix transcriptional regulator